MKKFLIVIGFAVAAGVFFVQSRPADFLITRGLVDGAL